ncbi:hypothetical protein ABT341_00070 [Pseudonocardia alni]|uniref:hypothetical protein n=1 Tax=Pseudonocardia alni TaxID=33907 RepID=UPI003329D0F7
MTEDTPLARGHLGLFQALSDEQMADGPPLYSYLRSTPIDPTPFRYDGPEVLARADAQRAENRRRLRELTARHAAVVARCSGTLRTVAEAHAPSLDEGSGSDTATCRGCSYDTDGWDSGPGEWPCWTFETIEENPA